MTVAESERRSSDTFMPVRDLQMRLTSIVRSEPRTTTVAPGVDMRMTHDNASLIGSTLRIGIMIAIALILILVLLPVALAAQAADLR